MSLLRFSVPELQTVRGAGLGNEVRGWAKALIGAHELGLRAVHPPWGLNARGYRRDFGTSIFDWPATQALRALPSITVDTNLAGRHEDYAEVMAELREHVARTRGPLVVWHTSGMAGGSSSIRRARPLIRAELTRPAHVAGNLYQIEKRLDPRRLTIALHIRAGDFGASHQGPRPGEFNRMVPIGWYRNIARDVRRRIGDAAQFLVFTDDPANPDIRRLSNELRAVPLPERRRPMLSDVLTMAQADLLVCSVSSLSILAAYLSEKPYIWYGPHLGEIGEWQGIWAHEPGQRQGLTARNATGTPLPGLLTRGMAADEAGVVSGPLTALLEQVLALKDVRRDLIMYGVVPRTEDR
ncbi:hypothetical protein PU560_13405 [Georgenia sp. 10Sc9-8]|uniref:Uncharacterized protein n=1 Tax=Georgenia halotolerans TaxID=3028317 RepID=A0ABT5TZF9_9MICO|nr:hypothetical protein [Georgenia halotolerans]